MTTALPIADQVHELLSPLVEAEGMELIAVEWVREQGGWILRLFIDREGGVGLDECTQVSRAVEPTLDVEDIVPSAYSLEVSSPGLNRPLKRLEHFRKVAGSKIRVQTERPLGDPPRKRFLGTLAKVEDEGAVVVDVEGAGAYRIPLEAIARANLEYEF